MKKYLVLGIMVAVAVMLFSFSLKQESDAGCALSFYGTAESGKTVRACKLPGADPCYETTANAQDEYAFINICDAGLYEIGDGCQTFQRYWNGSDAVELNICVSNPPFFCPCF